MEEPLEIDTSPRTGWVRPPTPIRGLDHLGVQAPCIALYGQLLPGITNVTDRARYFSFYPWVVWSFERRYSDRSKDNFRRVLRRADCLFALVAAFHELATQGSAEEHGAATVGRDKMRGAARAVLEGEAVDLGKYAASERKLRYFKNPLGGLGQYYFGPLRDLRILDYVDGKRSNPLGYDRSRGVALAEAFEVGVDSARFFDAIDKGLVARADIEQLVSFCPCGLGGNEVEQRHLLDLCFARERLWVDDEAPTRRTSLALVLDLVERAGSQPRFSLTGVMRGAAYSGKLRDGSPWEVPAAWQRVRRGWGAYSRNELFSVAMQAVLWLALRAIDRAGGRVASVEAAGQMIRDVVLEAVGSRWRDGTVGDAVEALRESLPPLEQWGHEDHEISVAGQLVRATAEAEPKDQSDVEVARRAVTVLLSLLARGLRDNPYIDFELDSGYFSAGDLHLLALKRRADRWMSLSFPTWLEWLGTRWAVERHLHVALRKLRAQNQDTFRLRPLDGSLRLIEIPPVVFTNPRLTRAEQVLRDLGLVTTTDAGTCLTDLGRSQLEACRAK